MLWGRLAHGCYFLIYLVYLWNYLNVPLLNAIKNTTYMGLLWTSKNFKITHEITFIFK